MKKILSIILGVFLFITPMAGCLDFLDKKSNETSIVFSFEQDGDMCIEKDGETLEESKFSYTYYVSFKDQINWQGTRYLLEDSRVKEEFYSIVSGKTITLEKTEETTMPKGMSVCIYMSFEKTIDFTIAQDGSIWDYAREDGKLVYYSSQSGIVDYADILSVYKDLDYEYPYTLKRTDDGQIVFGTSNETVFSFNQADVYQIQVSSGMKDSWPTVIDDKSWLDVIFDIVFKKEIFFRESVEMIWNIEEIIDVAFIGDVSKDYPQLCFCYGGYIYFYDRVSEKYYVSNLGVSNATSLEWLRNEWIAQNRGD